MSELPSRRQLAAVTAFGKDAPGLVAEVTGTIARCGGNIIDIEQSCRRGIFTIFLVVDLEGGSVDFENLKRELNDLGKSTGLSVSVDILRQGRRKADVERILVTSLGKDRKGILAQVSRFYKEMGVNIESTKMIARGEFFSMEMVLDISELRGDFEAFRHGLQKVHSVVGLSVVIQKEDVYHKVKKLIVFDVEGTLLSDKYVDAVAGALNLGSESSKISERESDGQLSFEEALKARAALLRGMKLADVERIVENLTLTPGTIELIETLKEMGFKIALISSGFNLLTKRIFEKTKGGVDYAFANELVVDDDGTLTGEVQEPVIDEAKKTELLEFIADVENLSKDEIIAIGDGEHDQIFLKQSGLSIAFRPEVAETLVTDGVVTTESILNLLYCFGLPESEIKKRMER
ncbi:MAG: phosphoserine phosphatase SerB [Promethearchaeota archaeon]